MVVVILRKIVVDLEELIKCKTCTKYNVDYSFQGLSSN